MAIAAMRKALERDTFPLADFIAKFHGKPRVDGIAVYLTGRTDVVPVALLHNLKHNKVLHQHIVLLHVATANTPRVEPARRVDTTTLDDEFLRDDVELRLHGAAEHPLRAVARICVDAP